MAISLNHTVFLFLLLSTSLTPSLLHAFPSTTTITPRTACDATPYPTFCNGVLNNGHGSGNLYDYGRFSVARSLNNAIKFSGMIDRYLSDRAFLSVTAIRALEDCKFLSDLNVDFLVSSGSTLNSTTNLLDPQADTVQAFLSALLTNQQTCLDGITAAASSWSFNNGISAPLSNGTKLYSISLALFSKGWVRNRRPKQSHHGLTTRDRIPTMEKASSRRGRSLLFHEVEISKDGSGDLPLRMSGQNRKLIESRSGRRLLQSSDMVLVNDVVVVSQDGTGNFTTVSDAVSSAPNKTAAGDGYFLVYVTKGVYEENVIVPKNKKYLMMVGDGINQTVITGNRSVVDGWTTFNSATFAVVGQGFVATNITFRNTAGAIKHQAVAVRNGADLSSFYHCSFEGYQDTLYTHSLRQFYRQCDIYGTVDFIFGNAAVVFQDCNIYSRLPMRGQSNTITAQGRTDPNQNTGISIQTSNFLTTPDLLTDNSIQTYLGRPWKNYSRTVISESFMDGSINSAGWLPWDGDFALSSLYYAEFNNTGPGSDTSKRVTWAGYHVITSTDASNFTVNNFLSGDDWLPQTGVPYTSGLL